MSDMDRETHRHAVGMAARAPLTFSRNIFSQPAALTAST